MAENERRFRQDDLNVLQNDIKEEHSRMEKQRLEKAKAQSKIDFKNKQEQLLNQILEVEEQYGNEHYLVVLLTKFYEASVEMENVMKSMEAVNVAMECVTEAMSFLDSCVNFDRELTRKVSAQSYSFFARMKMKREQRKARKNNIGRMKAMVDGMLFKYRMMTDMVKSLESFADDMGKAFKKVGAKGNKKGQPVAPSKPSEAQRRLAEARAQRGMSAPSTATSGASYAAATSDGGSYDDIL
ncbi:MAG: hypothetical protein IJA88_03680 [Clostridia bacterium]|nr:hypothetical protein [Clostridia bacterium]